MNILAVDDEKLALENMMEAIREVAPRATLAGARDGEQALALAEKTRFDLAFLDIEMRGISGLELAKRLKERNRRVNVIFATGHDQYPLDAFSLAASDYLLKPITPEKVRRAMGNLRFPLRPTGTKKLQIHCFGSFEVYANGEPLLFGRAKTKEMLAYLVDRKGSTCSMGELLAVLWEDKPNSSSQQSNLRNLISDLKNTLASVDAEDVILKGRNVISIRENMVDCDYYDFLKGVPYAVHLYQGAYMEQYSWAEETLASLPLVE
ncbi:MAG: response regulator [Oscillospiraceae bacterium]|nr:response regulator [Oscillospiraceae bacterium]